MKKIIIVNNNMKVGGVQKSLYNLLWSIDYAKYDVTLVLFSKTGDYIKNLPEGVRVIECGGPFEYLGKSQGEFKNSLKDTVARGFLATVSRFFGRDRAIQIMLKKQPVLDGQYDCAISFLHNGRREAFYGGTQDYVHNCVNAAKKVAFLHCDYCKCGANHPENNRLLAKFDKIAACSDGCRAVFENAVPELAKKAATVRNCHRHDEIKSMAIDEPHKYDDSAVNVVLVARLSHEKGIDRAISAVKNALANGLAVKLHIVGDGSMRDELENMSADMRDNVIFYGEQSNPYRYMKNADLLLLTSHHEAAPMVIDEARILGLPVLTTETTSSKEMVADAGCGWVCDNTQEALNKALSEIVGNRECLKELKEALISRATDNKTALEQFDSLICD